MALDGSNLEVVEAFDRALARRYGTRSIFDLAEKKHVHEWEVGGSAPQGYWKIPANVQRVSHHLLIEHRKILGSADRQEVLAEITALPKNLAKYFFGIGLKDVMDALPDEERGSPLAILKAYDRFRMELLGDASLFDYGQKYHLHWWEIGGAVPQRYWKNRQNVVNAVYHVLTESYPELGSARREEVVRAVGSLPENIQRFMKQKRLNGMMNHGFPKGETDSIVGVMRAFDEGYKLKTEDTSLFDAARKPYIEVYVTNRNRIRAVL